MYDLLTILTLYCLCFYDWLRKPIKIVINILEKFWIGYCSAFIYETKQTTRLYNQGLYYTGPFTQCMFFEFEI